MSWMDSDADVVRIAYTKVFVAPLLLPAGAPAIEGGRIYRLTLRIRRGNVGPPRGVPESNPAWGIETHPLSGETGLQEVWGPSWSEVGSDWKDFSALIPVHGPLSRPSNWIGTVFCPDQMSYAVYAGPPPSDPVHPLLTEYQLHLSRATLEPLGSLKATGDSKDIRFLG